MGLYVLDGHTPVLCEDILEWDKKQGAAVSKRIVAQVSRGDILVSTVFLGIDHGWNTERPILFETMVFGGKHDQYQDRYCTWDEAEAGHWKTCERVFGIARTAKLKADMEKKCNS
jgi:hypothetical protein